MTDNGTFIVNGVKRVVLNQISKSPGIYYKTEFDNDKKRLISGTIIPEQGSWLRIEIDKDGILCGRMNKSKKIPIFVLLQALGLTQKKIFYTIEHPEFLIKSLEDFNPESSLEALKELQSITQPNIKVSEENLQDASALFSNFLDEKKYSLGEIGRARINKKLKLKNLTQSLTLRPEDILAATNYLINLAKGIGNFDDIDDLKNRRIKSVGELFQNQVKTELTVIKKIVLDKIKGLQQFRFVDYLTTKRIGQKKALLITLESVMNIDYFIGNSLLKFLTTSQLSQVLDDTNPLAEITHKRRISSFGPGGLSQEKAGLIVREIHASHYGRICPIETPEGLNAGLITSLTTHARVNKRGFIEAPFHKVNEGISRQEVGTFFLSSEQEEERIVAPKGLSLSMVEPDTKIPARTRQEFITTTKNQIDFIGISPIQMISVATALIPFLEHDDANRALMGSNMQRQAVPLIKPKRPRIGTGLEVQIARDSSSVITAKKSGVISHVSSKKIILKRRITNRLNDYTKNTIYHQYQSLIEESREENYPIKFQNIEGSKKKEQKNKYANYETIRYDLRRYIRTNQETFMDQAPIVYPGEFIQKGDPLTHGGATEQGELALGQDILVAYMPWEGYNFEDAIVISERLVNEDIYTSIHFEKYEIDLEPRLGTLDRVTRDIPGINKEILMKLDNRGLIRVGSWVKSGDILVGKVTPKNGSDETPEEKLLRAIFGEKKGQNVKNSSFYVPKGVIGRVHKVTYITDKCIQVLLIQKRKIQIGDKVAGRHGNKGIVSNILPQQDMPYLQDGTPVDMILNPLGVPSRMNVGQIFECILGLAGHYLEENYKIVPFDEMYGHETSRNVGVTRN